ncbi:HEC/Ndc80p family-domain-containing protein [Irpex rosettiformis]|uniref:HEC/Ndc80p family-domain-containing protein n=1 Tax=Irpex rosettiformis TaxID=378272 RepID=A0ACB8TPN5_9APHY|nr:HEC/Ndc80p family-domain-containing protein [Irpex rosettiformis]
MQPPSDPYGNPRSHIPMPSTAKKTSSQGRMSMSGPALRAPYPLSSGPGPTPRQSMKRSQNTNLLMSVSKPQFGRTPMSNRRTSTWGGGSQNAAPSGSQVAKDPRPLRERPFQSKMRQDIVEWFQQNEYDLQTSALMNITAKDFRGIFEQLVLCLDPDWPFDPNKRFEDQLLQALKALQYPYVNNIDMKWLATPGAQFSWPSLLGMLHWLAELGKARESYLSSADPTLQEVSLVPDQFDNIHHHEALAFEHYIESYQLFLQGADLFPEQERQMEERYARKDGKVLADLQENKERLVSATTELKKLKESDPPLKELETMVGWMTKDLGKFKELAVFHENRKQKLIGGIAHENAEIQRFSGELDRLQIEQARLEEVVKAQNLSPEEVLRMNTEHETLTRDLEHFRHKISESSKLIHRLEVALGKKTSDTEEVIDNYNNMLVSLGLFPSPPPPMEGLNLELTMNSGAADPSQLVLGPSLKEVVKPTLGRITELKKTENADMERDKIKLDDELDRIAVACENKEQDVGEILKKANTISEQADDLRDRVQREGAVSADEVDRLENSLAQARSAAMTHGVGVKTRLHALQIAYAEQVDKVNRLRDDTVRAIIKNSNEVVMFKEEVSRQLKQVHDFAQTN